VKFYSKFGTNIYKKKLRLLSAFRFLLILLSNILYQFTRGQHYLVHPF